MVRPESEELSALCKSEGCEVVVCDNAAEGMGASLACAARAAGDCRRLPGRARRHAVRAADDRSRAVRDALAGGAPLAAPYFRARRGHPVGIARELFQDLLALQGDEGAKRLLAAHDASDGKNSGRRSGRDPRHRPARGPRAAAESLTYHRRRGGLTSPSQRAARDTVCRRLRQHHDLRIDRRHAGARADQPPVRRAATRRSKDARAAW